MAVIEKLEPNVVPRNTESVIKIIGYGFTGATEIVYYDSNGKEIPITTYTVNNDTQITMTCPIIDRKEVDINVKVNGKWSTTKLIEVSVFDGNRGCNNIMQESNGNRLRFVYPSFDPGY